MRGQLVTFMVAFVIVQVNGYLKAHDGMDIAPAFSNEWIVNLEGSEEGEADALASQLGYENVGEIDGFPNYYLMRKTDHPETAEVEADHHTRSLESDVKVRYAQQLFHKIRVKRLGPDVFERPEVRRRGLAFKPEVIVPGEDGRGIPDNLYKLWQEAKNKDGVQALPKTEDDTLFSDPLWEAQWYMHDTRTMRDLPQLDLNVLGCYRSGINGTGIKVTVLDDGLEHDHDDLVENYDPSISWDYNSGYDGDPDPAPRYPKYAGDFPNSHGTRCAGEVAMAPNNNKCGVGIAFGARIGGIRMLDGKIDDRVEGMSIKHGLDKGVDVFTASWGPSDDGKTVEGPGKLAKMAFEKGVTEGRDGKGVVYVWAGGNGGVHHDNCNCDGYTSNIHTLSIGSASQRGEFPWYGEMCSSTFATTYSSGAYSDQKIATTDNKNECTVSHTGTSAAAPLAAGIVALALQANPDLTWRDVQHLVAWTSDNSSLTRDTEWRLNGAGLKYSHRFGFGMMNAGAMVDTAMNWKNVGKQQVCKMEIKNKEKLELREGTLVSLPFSVDCPSVQYLEHVQLISTLQYPVRGDLEIVLRSPTGTLTQLLSGRPEDLSNRGFTQWPFTSVHLWGEDPNGEWTLYINVKKTKSSRMKNALGSLDYLELNVYGTTEMPQIMLDRDNGARSARDHFDLDSSLENFFNTDVRARSVDWDALVEKK